MTVIPDMAQVQITNLESITEKGEMEEGHYMNHDLKLDVLLLAHNCAQHPSLAQTTRNVVTVATDWFKPGSQV